jgi:porin
MLLFVVMCLIPGEFCLSEETEREVTVTDFWRCVSPTDGFWGLNQELKKHGMELEAGLTSTYQANAHGGTSTHKHAGRWMGRYDLMFSADMKKLVGAEGGSFNIHAWGGWPDSDSIDDIPTDDGFGINALTVGDRSLDVVEAFYKGPFFSNKLTWMIGKLDFTWIFDASEYADDECCQFLNLVFVNDPTIPFPQQGLGVVLIWDITDRWYLMGGAQDAQADCREAGFDTTFGGEDYFFYDLENVVGIELEGANGPMEGTYRSGMWIDDQDKERFSDGRMHRSDTGIYTSCDQMIYKENADIEDTQGLGIFFRYGWADSKVNEVTNFWSVGLQYQGLFESRDEDILGMGFAHGTFSNNAIDYVEDYESVFEVYYNAQLTPWLNLSPSIQYVTNPGGAENIRDAVILGLRVRMEF